VAQKLNRPTSPAFYTGRLENVSFGATSGNMAHDAAGNMYVTDLALPVIRRISSTGNVTVVAGRENSYGSANGTGSQARFRGVAGIIVNREGTELLVAEGNSHTIRRVALNVGSDPANADNWTVSMIAGTTNTPGNSDGSGTEAKFNFPWGLAGFSNDAIYLSEVGQNRIRLLQYVGGDRAQASSWAVTFVCGSTTGNPGFADGSGSSARFNIPYGVSLTKNGILYIADAGNNRIRALNTANGQVSTVAGTGDFGNNDSTSATSGTLLEPFGVVADDSGAVYFSSGSTVRRLLNGSLKTVAGGGSGEGTTGDTVQFGIIYGVGINRQGDVTLITNRQLVRLTRKLGR
jgi:hypothetical protein